MKKQYFHAFARALTLAGLCVFGSAHAVTYDFKFAAGAQRIPALTEVGQYIHVEVSANAASAANDVLFKFTSAIPQPIANVARFSFDVGQYTDLFSAISVFEQVGTTIVSRPVTSHPYLPNFTADFQFGVLNQGLYDSRALSSGESLTLSAVLGSGKSFSDVVNALSQGIDANTTTARNGLRLGVIAYNLLGIRPDPTKTLMDDAGYITAHVTAVPEVQTSALFLAGLAGLVGVYRRRRAS